MCILPHLLHIIEVQQQCCMPLEAVCCGQQGREGVLVSQEMLARQVPAGEASAQATEQQRCTQCTSTQSHQTNGMLQHYLTVAGCGQRVCNTESECKQQGDKEGGSCRG